MRFGLAVVIACAAVIGLGACTSTYDQRETAGTETTSIRLDRNKKVFIAIPADGQYGNRAYAGTGRVVAQKTAAAFSRYASQVEIATAASTNRDELLAAARKVGAGYLVVPTIAHWERRATEWSGIPARVSIGLAIVDVGTGADLRSGLLESRSAPVTLVRPNPDEMAEHLLDDYVSRLYPAPS